MHDNTTLAIINIYRHPNQFTPPSILDALFQFLFNNFNRVLISGDFNAHHSWWGCDYEDQAGRILSHAFDSFNLITINDGRPTLILPPSSRRSIIDLVVVSPSLAPLCYSYTDLDTAGSDHFPVFTIIGGTPSKKCKFKYKLKINKKDSCLLNHNQVLALTDSQMKFLPTRFTLILSLIIILNSKFIRFYLRLLDILEVLLLTVLSGLPLGGMQNVKPQLMSVKALPKYTWFLPLSLTFRLIKGFGQAIQKLSRK